MLDPSASRLLEGAIAAFRRGVVFADQVRYRALNVMPQDRPGDVVERLPPEVAESLFEWVMEASAWSEQEWDSLIVGGSDESAWPELRRQTRARWAALKLYFAAKGRAV
jgi:hypothetical protein